MRFSRNWPSGIQVERSMPCHVILKLNLGFFFLQVGTGGQCKQASYSVGGCSSAERLEAYVSSDGRKMGGRWFMDGMYL